MKLSVAAAAIIGIAGSVGFALPASASAAASPCPTTGQVRTDTGSAGSKTYTLCSYDPGMGKMEKDLYVSTDGGADALVGQAPYDGITRGFVVASETTLALGAAYTSADACQVDSSFDGGATWTTTLTGEGEPVGLAFSDADHGSVTCSGASGDIAYVTSDGGHTWTTA